MFSFWWFTADLPMAVTVAMSVAVAVTAMVVIFVMFAMPALLMMSAAVVEAWNRNALGEGKRCNANCY